MGAVICESDNCTKLPSGITRHFLNTYTDTAQFAVVYTLDDENISALELKLEMLIAFTSLAVQKHIPVSDDDFHRVQELLSSLENLFNQLNIPMSKLPDKYRKLYKDYYTLGCLVSDLSMQRNENFTELLI